MPQAIEWSLATPMISPRLPCISWLIAHPLQRRLARATGPGGSPPRAGRWPVRERHNLSLIRGGRAGVRRLKPAGVHGRLTSWRGPGLGIEPLEDDTGVGAAKTKCVRQHAAELHLVAARPHNRHIGKSRI